MCMRAYLMCRDIYGVSVWTVCMSLIKRVELFKQKLLGVSHEPLCWLFECLCGFVSVCLCVSLNTGVPGHT